MLHWLPFTIYFLINCFLLGHFGRRYQHSGPRLTIMATFIYLTAILILCLTPSFLKISSAHKTFFHLWGVPYNLIPFQGVSTEFFLNIIMTLPWGVFLYLFHYRHSWGRTIAYCFLFSLFIEVNQFIWDLLINLGRLADIDDLITNTLGALVGFSLMLLLDYTYFHGLIQQLRLKSPQSLVH